MCHAYACCVKCHMYQPCSIWTFLRNYGTSRPRKLQAKIGPSYSFVLEIAVALEFVGTSTNKGTAALNKEMLEEVIICCTGEVVVASRAILQRLPTWTSQKKDSAR